jgi:hypothetical protein
MRNTMNTIISKNQEHEKNRKGLGPFRTLGRLENFDPRSGAFSLLLEGRTYFFTVRFNASNEERIASKNKLWTMSVP